ncbi:MAG: PEP-CTERM sorting domain-containing protein [Acidobacteria bacterium]|nr:PEP-CTERM sorting domain-containing protein [Acidobacteriota bacterium]
MRLCTIALFTLLFTMTATAIPLPITVSDPGGYGGSIPVPWNKEGSLSDDVLGLLRNFDLDYVKFTAIEAGKIEAEIHVNYASGGVNPITGSWNYWINGHQLTTGDLLFDVDGVYKYGVALTDHDSLTAGALYHITNSQLPFVLDSDAVLETEAGIRKDIPVWIDSGNATQVVGSGISLSSHRDGTTAAWYIDLSFVPTAQFLLDLAHTGAQPGLSVHFASATCANDFLHGNIQYSPVPEPMSMVLMGVGLLALGLFGRRFRRG